jgi:hypothetical protein
LPVPVRSDEVIEEPLQIAQLNYQPHTTTNWFGSLCMCSVFIILCVSRGLHHKH